MQLYAWIMGGVTLFHCLFIYLPLSGERERERVSEGKNGKFEPIARPGGLRVVDCSVLVLKAGLYFSRALVSRDIPLPSLPFPP